MCNCTNNEFERPSADSNCTDNDECSEEHNPCTGPFELCLKDIGSFMCDCMTNGLGRPSADTNCTDIDECFGKQNPCTKPFELYQKEDAVSCVTVWPTLSEHILLTPIAPILMNVPKNKTHALGHSNYIRKKMQFHV